MCASPLAFFRDGPPPPRVALLPDTLFFIRSIPVAPESTDQDERRREVTGQVELALEGLAPFPLTHLNHGYFWTDGAPRALVFAAYSRRFTAEQTATWAEAELVLPAFAALLHPPAEPATTVVIAAPESLTAIHWGEGAVPGEVVSRKLAPEATEEQRAEVRENLLRQFESRRIVDVDAPVTVLAGSGDGEFVGRAGELVSPFSAAEAAALDVRDKGELAARRRSRSRDILFWRAAVACFAAFGLLAVGELALVGGHLWEKTRDVRLRAQAPLVQHISQLNDIADQIEDLRTKRLLPIEMIRLVGGSPVKPDTTQFLKATAAKSQLYTITFEAQTPNAAEIPVYRNNLTQLPQVAPNGVVIQPTQTREAMSQFRADVTFKPGAVKLSPPAS